MTTADISIRVRTPDHTYPCLMVRGSASELARTLESVAGTRPVFVVLDSGVDASHGAVLRAALSASSMQLEHLTVMQGGEDSKSWVSVQSLLDEWLSVPITRKAVVIAIGGGAVGDSTGFAASLVLRGVPVIQVPTTLLSMADASIGGKTAVNAGAGKNLIGTFHHPLAVIAWPSFLTSLPVDVARAGLAEIVKCAILDGEDAMSSLESLSSDLVDLEPDAVLQAISLACRVKARIVEADPSESGLRKLLNLGHTFGHAVERIHGYGQISHGHAVAIGIDMVCRFGESLGVVPSDVTLRARALLESVGFDLTPPAAAVSLWLEAIGVDKKREGSEIEFVFPRQCGQCVLQRVELPVVEAWLELSVCTSVAPSSGASHVG
jgi:3-dehydroquinate synthase